MNPLFSIIIPTFNRSKQLVECLRSMVRLDYPVEKFEIIIVDDGGSSVLKPHVDPFENELNITLLKQKNSGPASARNLGAKNSKGEILVFLDDDCIPPLNWLYVLEASLAEQPASIIGGKIVNKNTSNIYAIMSQLTLDFFYINNRNNENNPGYISTCNLAVPKTIFNEIKGFNSKFRISEDREFCDRIISNCFDIVYLPDLLIQHNDYIKTFSGYCARSFRYGRGAYKYNSMRKLRGLKNIYRNSSLFYKNLKWLFYPFKNEKFGRALKVFILLIVWHLSISTGLLWESLVSKKLMADDFE